jgi:DNA-binding NarL/FixJ family response regulator
MNRIVVICSPTNREQLHLIFYDNNEIHIIAYVFDGLEALKQCSQTEVDLILMVLTNDFEPMNWIQVISTKFPKVKILVMIETIMNNVLFSALKNGASGYMLFTNNCERIINAINLCLLGFFTTEQVCMKSLMPLMNAGDNERNRTDDHDRID